MSENKEPFQDLTHTENAEIVELMNRHHLSAQQARAIWNTKRKMDEASAQRSQAIAEAEASDPAEEGYYWGFNKAGKLCKLPTSETQAQWAREEKEEEDAETIQSKKLEVLESLEKKFNVEESLGRLADALEKCPELEPLLVEYLMAIFLAGKGRVDRFEISVQAKRDGEQTVFTRAFKFFDKAGKEVSVENFSEILK